jgi:hypothetical protein
MLAKEFLGSFICLAVAAAIFWRGISAYRKKKRLAQIGVHTLGVVVNVEWDTSGDGSDSPVPTIRFQDCLGRVVEVTLNEGNSWENYTVGQSVDVTYNPQNPQQASVGSPESLADWLNTSTVLMVLIATPFLLLGAFILIKNLSKVLS